MKSVVWLLVCCLPSCAATYFVANSGDDSNPGTSSSAPWKTLAKVNSSSFGPGDSILLKSGDVWQEQFVPPSSGSPGNPITISSYGVGAKPVVSGANLITQWTGSGSTPVPPAPPTGCSGSCIFSSGMESANFSDWSQVYLPAADGTSVTQSSSIVHSGSFSAKLTGGGTDNRAGLYESFPAMVSEETLFFRFYMYVPAGALKANDNFVLFQVPTRSSNVSLGTDGNGNISSLQFYSTGGSVVPSTPIPFVMGAWNYLEVAFKVGASDGGGQVWLNGVSIGSNYTLDTHWSIGADNITVGFDSYGHGQVAGGSVYLDDFEIATSGPIGPLATAATTTSSSNPTGIWSASVPTQPNVVFIAGNLGVQEYAQSQLNAPGQWYWTGGTLYTYSNPGPPSGVEAAQRDYALLLGQTGGGNYTTVTGIDFRLANIDVVHIVNTSGDTIDSALVTGGYQRGIYGLGVFGGILNHVLISNNTVSYNGATGIELASGHTNATIQGNTVFDSGFNPSDSGPYSMLGGIKCVSDPGVPNYDLVQYNVSDNNGVYTGDESLGSGIWFDTISDSTMQYNVSFKNASHGLYLEKTINSQMLNNVSYSNAFVPNSANLTAYASQGLASSGNLLAYNTAWDSHTWGMKVGAYEGAGATPVYNNTYENNIAINSAGVELYVDNGADNDGVNGSGNVISANAFGPAEPDFLAWASCCYFSTYAQLDSLYGSSTNSIQSNWSQTIGGQERCGGSCIFSSGMETSNLSDWSSFYAPGSDGTKVSQIGSVANSGNYSLQITGGGVDNRGGLTQSFSGGGGTLYFRFYLNVPAHALQANDQFLIFQVPAGGSSVSLGTDSNGNVVSLQYSGSGGTIIPATAISFPMGTWNYLDIAYKPGSGNGGGQVWVNGTYVGGSYSVSTAATNSATVGNGSYGHGQVAGGNIYIDDFRIATAGPIGAASATLPVQVP